MDAVRRFDPDGGVPRHPAEPVRLPPSRRGGLALNWDVTPLTASLYSDRVLLRTLEAFKTFGTIRVLTGGDPGFRRRSST